jgi:signal transduction histidine kinase
MSMQSPLPPSTSTLDRPPLEPSWRAAAMLLPRRRFSAAELARAGIGGPRPVVAAALAVNLLLPAMVLVSVFPLAVAPGLLAAALAYTVLMALAMWRAWADPSDRWVRWAYWVLPLASGLGFGLWARKLDPGVFVVLMLFFTFGALMLWFVIIHRHQHVVQRLRELDERDRALALARRLSAAQIQPHFLFNSLASLQQWVATRDERAAPMLDALTDFLRTTLPMFELDRLPLARELHAAQRYLTVMQLRLGQRLRHEVAPAPEAAGLALPPGIVLTLVENAVEHAVMPGLAGGRIDVRCGVDGGRAWLEVADDGPGPPPDDGAATAGVGLRNSRARLFQAFGDDARLTLNAAPDGGCIARIEWPRSAA